jgi:hypothetical protein
VAVSREGDDETVNLQTDLMWLHEMKVTPRVSFRLNYSIGCYDNFRIWQMSRGLLSLSYTDWMGTLIQRLYAKKRAIGSETYPASKKSSTEGLWISSSCSFMTSVRSNLLMNFLLYSNCRCIHYLYYMIHSSQDYGSLVTKGNSIP